MRRRGSQIGVRWRFAAASVIAVASLAVFAALGAATSTITSVTVVDAENTGTAVSATPSPGSVVRIRTAVSSDAGDRWRSTRWTVGSKSDCDNANRDGDDATITSDASFTLPSSASVTVTVQLFPNDSCSGTATSSKSIAVAMGTVAPNGPLTQDCARRVALVLDESGSIGAVEGGIASVREGAKAFVNGLADTGSELAVIEFNTQSRTVPLSGNVYNPITTSYANGAFATYINGQGSSSSTRYNPKDYSGTAQYTNWQDGLLDTGALDPLPQLVIFVTDGDPTARNTSSGPETGFEDGSYLVMNPAFIAANAVKSNAIKSRIFALGVGAAVTDPNSLTRLQAISGPKEFNGANALANSDYVLVDNFEELGPALAQIAASLCSVRLHVVKQVDELDGAGFKAANGWDFTGTVSVSGTAPNSYKWLAPGVAQGPPAANPSRTGATTTIRDTPGRLDFVWLPAPTSLISQILVEETLEPGYEFVSASCASGVPLPAVSLGGRPSVTVSGLAVNEDATCTFKNRRIPAEVTVVKVFDGTPVSVDLLVDNVVRKTGSTATFTTGPVSVRPGRHQISEQFTHPDVAVLYASSYACVAGTTTVAEGDGTVVEGGVEAVSGQNVTCTFTNRKDTSSTGEVSKTAVPPVLDEPEGQVRFPVVVVNTSRAPATIRALRDDVFGNLDANSPADDHGWISSSCLVGTTLAAFDGTPGGDDTYACAFTGRVVGSPADPHTDTVTVTLEDATGDRVDRSDDATVSFRDVPPAIDVQKIAEPTYVQDRGPATYTVVVTNTSKVDPLRVDQLADSVYGDLIAGPNTATCEYGGEAVSLPFTLPVGQSMSCRFQVTVTDTVTDTVTGSGTDDEGNRVTDADDAIVTVGKTPAPLPPPPEPPVEPTGDPEVALAVVKTQPERAYVGRGLSAWITDLRVVNRGTDPAPGTTLDDPAPPSTRFLRIVEQPSQGTCTLRNQGRHLHCAFGTLAGGNSVGNPGPGRRAGHQRRRDRQRRLRCLHRECVDAVRRGGRRDDATGRRPGDVVRRDHRRPEAAVRRRHLSAARGRGSPRRRTRSRCAGHRAGPGLQGGRSHRRERPGHGDLHAHENRRRADPGPRRAGVPAPRGLGPAGSHGVGRRRHPRRGRASGARPHPGASGEAGAEIRTPDLPLTRRLLWPTELRRRAANVAFPDAPRARAPVALVARAGRRARPLRSPDGRAGAARPRRGHPADGRDRGAQRPRRRRLARAGAPAVPHPRGRRGAPGGRGGRRRDGCHDDARAAVDRRRGVARRPAGGLRRPAARPRGRADADGPRARAPGDPAGDRARGRGAAADLAAAGRGPVRRRPPAGPAHPRHRGVRRRAGRRAPGAGALAPGGVDLGAGGRRPGRARGARRARGRPAARSGPCRTTTSRSPGCPSPGGGTSSGAPTSCTLPSAGGSRASATRGCRRSAWRRSCWPTARGRGCTGGCAPSAGWPTASRRS